MLKENLLDVLLYLFENYMDSETGFLREEGELSAELLQAGFDQQDIKKAVNWLDELQVALGAYKRSKKLGTDTIRIFSGEECLKISNEARGYVLYLERIGFIDAKSRELIIDRAMTLDGSVVDVMEIKWISLTVLLTQPEHKDKLVRLEALVLKDQGYIRH